ncbi:DUF2946 family protein [Sphingobium sp. CCH11-B1]|jgi:hypothetical protein|uniref:DUF2946 family protein n=1 Tax=Sphingobium sp. CCH11-B1 TaxID=1768781 RepID=UPI00082B024F|nr:DUF2946 family protein [Sphingobium sp. CCH11-B1]MEA3390453.1 hypothetical protein [Pseudomonadota bacterium]
MNDRIRRSRGAKGLFALLLLCALAIRVAIPTGFMPTLSVHGLVITLCTGQGAVKAVLPIEKQGDLPDHQSKAGECAFAVGLGGGLIAPPATPMPALVPALPLLIASRAIANLTVHRLAAPPPPAQAPPARL